MASNSRSAWLANGGALLKQEADKAADKLARQFVKDIVPSAMAAGRHGQAETDRVSPSEASE
jgi:hypothetical protein